METVHRTSNSYRLSAVRRDLESVNDKLDLVNTKLEILNIRRDPINSETKDIEMDTRTQRLLELEERNRIHSAQLKLLQKEVDHVQTENDVLFGYIKNTDSPRGFPPQNETVDTYNNLQDERMFINSRASRDKGETGKEARFREFVPLSPNRNRRESPEPKPYEDTARDFIPPKKTDRNADEYRKSIENENPSQKQLNLKGKSADFDFEERQRQRRAEIYSFYDKTAINPHLWEKKPKHRKYPWYDHETHPSPGGFLIYRFDDAGHDVCTIALKSQQSICRHAGGYLMGIARKKRIFVLENVPSKQKNWTISRNQPYKDCLTTEDALAIFWFTKDTAACNFFDNCHGNRFRDPCFPTPNGYEAVYIPLLTPPTKPLNTFFCIELLDGTKYSPEDLTQFEGEVRNDMLRVYPNCHPMVVSSLTGRVMLKPGSLVSNYSKLYISRFESQGEVDNIWRLGMIQALRQKWRLTGPINVYSFSIDIAV